MPERKYFGVRAAWVGCWLKPICLNHLIISFIPHFDPIPPLAKTLPPFSYKPPVKSPRSKSNSRQLRGEFRRKLWILPKVRENELCDASRSNRAEQSIISVSLRFSPHEKPTSIHSSTIFFSSSCRINEEFREVQLSNLRVLATLGVGGFGRVELVQIHSDPSRSFALKQMKKSQIVETRQQQHIMSEKEIMSEANCEFIVKLFKTFKDRKYLYMLMESCLGGELWTILRDKGHFDDGTTRFYTACVVEAFDYLHSRNIIYRWVIGVGLSGDGAILELWLVAVIWNRRICCWTSRATLSWSISASLRSFRPAERRGLSAEHRNMSPRRSFWTAAMTSARITGHWAFLCLSCWRVSVCPVRCDWPFWRSIPPTGTPPFTGADPMRTYNIILKGIDAIEFPRNITRNASALIKKLCRDNPTERLGYQRGGIGEIRKHK